MAEVEYDEVAIMHVQELREGDLVLRKPGNLAPIVRRVRPVVLPTSPYTAIRSTWKSSGGIADFDALLLPLDQNVFTGAQLTAPLWLISDGSLLTAEDLASRIDYFTLKGVPVNESR